MGNTVCAAGLDYGSEVGGDGGVWWDAGDVGVECAQGEEEVCAETVAYDEDEAVCEGFVGVEGMVVGDGDDGGGEVTVEDSVDEDDVEDDA